MYKSNLLKKHPLKIGRIANVNKANVAHSDYRYPALCASFGFESGFERQTHDHHDTPVIHDKKLNRNVTTKPNNAGSQAASMAKTNTIGVSKYA